MFYFEISAIIAITITYLRWKNEFKISETILGGFDLLPACPFSLRMGISIFEHRNDTKAGFRENMGILALLSHLEYEKRFIFEYWQIIN